jgi:hypothetical protein
MSMDGQCHFRLKGITVTMTLLASSGLGSLSTGEQLRVPTSYYKRQPTQLKSPSAMGLSKHGA